MKGRNEKENKRSAATTVRTSDFKVTRKKKKQTNDARKELSGVDRRQKSNCLQHEKNVEP